MHHILTADQFSRPEIEKIFKQADYFKRQSLTLAGRRKVASRHQSRQLCSLFFQPSTRTRLSFETAAAKLGMAIVSTENAREHSSSAKGETIEDTFRVLDGYKFDAIVMRHYAAGEVAKAAAVCKTPIINAGDGSGEHPTQALLDAYTISQKHGRLKGLKIVIGGDLRHGRTIRSLARLLSKYKSNRITFVSVPQLQASGDIKDFLQASGTKFDETNNLKQAFEDADVVYWTRLQTEYLDNPKAVKQSFTIDEPSIKFLPKRAIIMHPLPRVDEISAEVDNDRRAIYFEQAANGLYIRMALLDMVTQNG